MNAKSTRPQTFLRAMFLTLLVSSLPVFAQPASDEKPKDRPTPPREPARGERLAASVQRDGMQGGLLPFMSRVLTEEQRTSFRDAMEGQRDKSRELEQKLRDARKDLLKASVAEKFDEDAVRKQALAVGKLDAELTVLRAKALSQVKPPLSAEQIEQLKNPPAFNPAEGQRQIPTRTLRKNAGPRDENDLPPKPKTEK